MRTSASGGLADVYHTGIIVDEVEYSDLTGVTWGAQGSVAGVYIELVDVALRSVMFPGDE
jgi:hypothetical protein